MSIDSINPDLGELNKIRQLREPEQSSGLALFLGLYKYYKYLIPYFAYISDVLYNIFKADDIPWTNAIEFKFEELKQQLL